MLCFSGVTTNKIQCGTMTRIHVIKVGLDKPAYPGDPLPYESPGREWDIQANLPVKHGDSGAPVWDRKTGRVVGIVSALGGFVTPLIHSPRLPVEKSPGALNAPGMGALQLKVAQ
jgi:hypothetical protein